MGDNGTLWLPERASTLAEDIDYLFYFVYWASVALFVLVVAGMIFFVFKYRRRSAHDQPRLVKENKLLEISWVVIPAILVLVIFTWGFQVFIKIGVAPPDAYEIKVRGQQWIWNFEYPEGFTTTSELRVPAGRPVRLEMVSEDVLHSFYVPAFRVKHDVLPNRYSYLWFETTRAGEFEIFCTEYCGTNHWDMGGKVIAMPPDEFNEWLQTGGGTEDLPLPEYGEQLYTQQGCNACHSVDGSRMVGPTWQGLYGQENHPMADGTTVTVDENYLRESIIEPSAKIVQGYSPVMPPYSSLSERQVSALIAYIEELQ